VASNEIGWLRSRQLHADYGVGGPGVRDKPASGWRGGWRHIARVPCRGGLARVEASGGHWGGVCASASTARRVAPGCAATMGVQRVCAFKHKGVCCLGTRWRGEEGSVMRLLASCLFYVPALLGMECRECSQRCQPTGTWLQGLNVAAGHRYDQGQGMMERCSAACMPPCICTCHSRSQNCDRPPTYPPR
jgi:hypothetical protein